MKFTLIIIPDNNAKLALFATTGDLSSQRSASQPLINVFSTKINKDLHNTNLFAYFVQSENILMYETHF